MAYITDQTFVIPIEIVRRHAEWSEKNFGTPQEKSAVGPLKHLSKEALEAATAPVGPERLEEYADCMFLLLDALRRDGYSGADLTAAMERKMPILEARTYKRTAEGEPAEHDRSIPDKVD